MKKIIALVAATVLATPVAFSQGQPKPLPPAGAQKMPAKKVIPEGATALCGDHSYSFNKSKTPCAGHGGVIRLIDDGKGRLYSPHN
jgi:hypothetical protein